MSCACISLVSKPQGELSGNSDQLSRPPTSPNSVTKFSEWGEGH